jgi:hypothetical protein
LAKEYESNAHVLSVSGFYEGSVSGYERDVPRGQPAGHASTGCWHLPTACPAMMDKAHCPRAFSRANRKTKDNS